MDTALQAMVQAAAGTGAPTNPSSRYYGYPVKFFTRPDGTQVAYLERRIIPQADIYSSVQSYVVVDGDRLDNLATKFLGDPFLFWIIADANTATDPDELTSAAQIGRTIQIPLPSGIPSGARNG
jgi:nucleoid-associated protein YgaU